MGKGFHSFSAKFIKENLTTGSLAGGSGHLWQKLVAGNPFLDAVLVLVPLLLISLPVIKDKDWRVKSLTIAGSSAVMYCLFRARELNFPELSDPTRTAVFFALTLPVLYAQGFSFFEKFAHKHIGKSFEVIKWQAANWAALALCLGIIILYPPGNLYRGQEEYDAAAQNYLKIKAQTPPLGWTIVGPPEQLYEVIGSGWHYEILTFVKNFSLDQARDPRFRIPIPTDYVFFYVEKKPLHFGREVTAADAARNLEPEGADPFMQYYKNKKQRAILEAKAIQWIDTYRQFHSGVKVFYEDSDFKIYRANGRPEVTGGV